MTYSGTREVPLLHNTAKPLAALNVFEQEHGLKPRGLWYGVGDAWTEWCRSEMPQWIREHTYEITLRADARVLRLQDELAILGFQDEYVSTDGWGYPDWKRLAKQYDGLEIAPYQWRLRLNLMWYYGWDCASGCIWNPRAIATVREIAPLELVGVTPSRKSPE